MEQKYSCGSIIDKGGVMDLATLWEVFVFSAWWITANIMVVVYFKKGKNEIR